MGSPSKLTRREAALVSHAERRAFREGHICGRVVGYDAGYERGHRDGYRACKLDVTDPYLAPSEHSVAATPSWWHGHSLKVPGLVPI